MKGYFVFIVNSSAEAPNEKVAMITAATPESEAALRDHIVSVKGRMRDLGIWEEAKRVGPQSDPPPSASV